MSLNGKCQDCGKDIGEKDRCFCYECMAKKLEEFKKIFPADKEYDGEIKKGR